MNKRKIRQLFEVLSELERKKSQLVVTYSNTGKEFLQVYAGVSSLVHNDGYLYINFKPLRNSKISFGLELNSRNNDPQFFRNLKVWELKAHKKGTKLFPVNN